MAKYYLIPNGLAAKFPALQEWVLRVEAAAMGALIAFLRALPLAFSMRLAGSLFRLVGPHTGKWKHVRGNLGIAFADKPHKAVDALARETFRYLGVALIELVSMKRLWAERERRLEFVLAEGAQMPPAGGRPAVFVTAHVGGWQLTNFLAARYGIPISIIYAPESNPHMQELMLKVRSDFPTQLVSRDGGLRSLMKELSEGNSVGLAVDTRLDGAEMIPFFGVDAPTNTAPARLALRYGCELIPLRTERLPGARYRTTLYPPIRPEDTSAATAEQALSMTRQLNARFEQWIADAPGQWMCLKRRWPNEAYPERKRKAEKQKLKVRS